MRASAFFGFLRRLLLGVWLTPMMMCTASFAEILDRLPEASDAQMRRFAIFFDFDRDSCYPSPAISLTKRTPPAVVINGGHSVDYTSTSYADGCREPAQLNNSNTYHRRAFIVKNGVTYSVRMYALYFMKDKDLIVNIFGHRHDWEFALVWTTNDKLTHAYASKHSGGDLKPVSGLHFDVWCPECVKVVYHKDGPTTHVMRFADENEKAENHTKYWVKPPIVDWWLLPAEIRSKLNTANFGQADCSVCDARFPSAISEQTPAGYPSKDEWVQAAKMKPLPHDLGKPVAPNKPTFDNKMKVVH